MLFQMYDPSLEIIRFTTFLSPRGNFIFKKRFDVEFGERSLTLISTSIFVFSINGIANKES